VEAGLFAAGYSKYRRDTPLSAFGLTPPVLPSTETRKPMLPVKWRPQLPCDCFFAKNLSWSRRQGESRPIWVASSCAVCSITRPLQIHIHSPGHQRQRGFRSVNIRKWGPKPPEGRGPLSGILDRYTRLKKGRRDRPVPARKTPMSNDWRRGIEARQRPSQPLGPPRSDPCTAFWPPHPFHWLCA